MNQKTLAKGIILTITCGICKSVEKFISNETAINLVVAVIGAGCGIMGFSLSFKALRVTIKSLAKPVEAAAAKGADLSWQEAKKNLPLP